MLILRVVADTVIIRQYCVEGAAIGAGVGAFTYSIDPKLQLTVVTVSGGVDLSLTEELVKTIFSDSNFDPQNRLLVDASRISWQANLAELEGMVGVSGRVTDLFQGGNALVVSDPVYEDLGDLFSTYARMNGVDWSVFNDFDKAYAWLFDADREKGPAQKGS